MMNHNVLEFTGREEISDPLTKRVARQSHHLTGLRDITKFLGQIIVPDSFQNTDSINGFRGLFGLNRAII